MLKYVSKFVLEIFPSVVATIVGAYIVNHYIVAKPADAPVTAAVSTAAPQAAADAKTVDKAATPDVKSSDGAKPSEPSAAKGKGTSEKAAIDKAPEKSADKPAETASVPVETRRHQPAAREKAAARAAPAAVAPSVATASAAPLSEAADDRRDANDLARAAIERLRNSGEAPRAPESVRVQQTPGVQEAPRAVSATPVQPLPPPIMVSTPSTEAFNPNAASAGRPPYAPEQRADDPRRLRPPGDIPTASRPLDLQADATGSTRPDRTSVADDMLSAAKSVFHAVLPK